MASSDSSDGAEPDYRMSLAAERTYLAYVRTALAMLAAGVAVVGALPGAGYEILRRVLGVVLVVLGSIILVTARMRWQAVDRAMREGDPLPPSHVSLVIGIGMMLSAALALVLVLVM